VSRTLPPAPSALRTTSALLRESRGPLAKVSNLLAAADPAVPAVARITRRVDPLLRPVRRALSGLLEPVRVLGAHGCDIDNFAENWRSDLGFGLAGGGTELPSGPVGPLNQFRVIPLVGTDVLEDFKVPAVASTGIRDMFPAPCRYSPGPMYPSIGGDR
jgi:hypothetical protein